MNSRPARDRHQPANEKSENALRLLNRISAQFHIGKWTDASLTGGSKAVFVANTRENFNWLAELPKKFLECVSLERVTTKQGSVTTVPKPSKKPNSDLDVTPRPRGLNYSEIVLVPTKGDTEHWKVAADFCCGYLCVIEDSYAKARKLDFETGTTPFRHLIDKEKSLQVKWIKYYTAAPMSQILGEELPPTPDHPLRTPVFFSGKFRKFMHQRCLPTTRDTRNYRNAFNLNQAVKKACPQVSREFILDAYRDHRKTMDTPPVTDGVAESDKAKYAALWQHGKWGVRWTNFEPTLFKPPGPSATLESQRSKGGGSVYAYNQNSMWDDREVLVQAHIVNLQLWRKFNDLGLADVFTDKVFATGFGFLWTWPERKDEYIQREPTVPTRCLTPSGETFLKWRNYSPSWEDIFSQYDSNDPNNHRVMVEGCVEPLKLRTITKGPCHRKWLSQCLQREMADCLDGMWQFSLNKRNSDHALIRKLYHKCDSFHTKVLRDQVFRAYPHAFAVKQWKEIQSKSKLDGHLDTLQWCSGDYKSATDSLEIHHTKAALEELLQSTNPARIREAYKQLFRDELYEQEIEYPSWTNIENVQQLNGQLMGSVLSFPILCVVNFVALWESLEEFYGMTFTADQIPCLIHGDDILFRTTPDHYAHWSEVIKRFGLKKSVGKNYFHPKVFTIDSELWIQGIENGQVSFKRYYPLNCGSLLNSAVDGRTAYQNAPIWDKFNSSIRGSQDKELFVKRYLYFNRSILKPMTWTRSGILNLFLPHMRGGLGFELPWQADRIPLKEDGEPLVRVTNYQRDMASAMCNSCIVFGPLKSYAILGIKPDLDEFSKPGGSEPKRFRIPHKVEWRHESEYSREIPGDLPEPILSSYPERAPEENRIRKPTLRELAKGPKRFRVCQHPPLAPKGGMFEEKGGDLVLSKEKRYPTNLFEFPYVQCRVYDPEIFWFSVVWAIIRLRGGDEWTRLLETY